MATTNTEDPCSFCSRDAVMVNTENGLMACEQCYPELPNNPYDQWEKLPDADEEAERTKVARGLFANYDPQPIVQRREDSHS